MRIFKFIGFILFSAGLFVSVQSQDLPAKSNRLVNDYVNLLTKAQKNNLEQKLVAFNDTNSTQITLLIVDDLLGYDIADYSQRVAEDWGVGQKKYDNGVIIVLKPKTASANGEVNIDVGYGMESIIPDITAKRIVENEMIPYFKNNDYYGGLDAAVNVIISLAAGQFTAEQYNKGRGNGFGNFVPIIVLIIIILIINRGSRNNRTMGGGRGPSLWTALWLGSMMGSSSGSYGNFRSGGGSFGGGGGFGGFGGGSFGGGGASGSW